MSTPAHAPLHPFRTAQAPSLPGPDAEPEPEPRRRRPRPHRLRPRHCPVAPRPRRRRLSEGRGLSRGEHLPGQRLPGDRAVDQSLPHLLPARDRSARSCSSTGGAQGHPGYTVVVPVLLALLFADLAVPRRRAVLLALRGSAPATTELKVIPPSPGAASRAPLVRDLAAVLRSSNKFGWAVPLLLTFNVRRLRRRATSTAPRCASTGGSARPTRAFDLGFLLPYVSSSVERRRVHLGAAAELLLAQRRATRTCWRCRSSTRTSTDR